MLVNLIIGALIFGYATYALLKHFKNSKKGKCATCELRPSCAKKEKDCCGSAPSQVYIKKT